MSGSNLTSDELVAQIKAVPEAWKKIFDAGYFEPDPPRPFLGKLTPEAEELLEPYPQRQKRLIQLRDDFNDLLRRAGKLAGAREDQDPLIFWLNVLRDESARFSSWGTGPGAVHSGFIKNVLDATVEVLERLERTGRLPLPAAHAAAPASAEEKQTAASSGGLTLATANEPAAGEDDDLLAFEIFLPPDATLPRLLTDNNLKTKFLRSDKPLPQLITGNDFKTKLTDIAGGLKTPPADTGALQAQMAEARKFFALAGENIYQHASSVEEGDLAFVSVICLTVKETDLAATWLEGRQEDDGFHACLAPRIRKGIFLLNEWAPAVFARQQLVERIARKDEQPDKSYVHQEFPYVLYRAGGETTIVHDEEEREAALAEGWSKEPSGAESGASLAASSPAVTGTAPSVGRTGRPNKVYVNGKFLLECRVKFRIKGQRKPCNQEEFADKLGIGRSAYQEAERWDRISEPLLYQIAKNLSVMFGDLTSQAYLSKLRSERT